MSDLSTLHNRIAALSPGRRGQPRQLLLQGQTKDAVSAFLNEIAETRLYRILTFKNSSGDILICSAHSGRLLRVQNIPELELSDFAEATEAEKMTLAAICRAFLSNTTSLTVEPNPSDDNPADLGIGLALSSANLNLTCATVDENEPSAFQLESFADTLQRVSTALVRVDDGQIATAHGKEPERANLLELAQEEVSQRRSVGPDPSTQHFVLLSTDQTARGQAAICAAIADSVLFAAFPNSEMDNVLEHWAKCRVAA